MLWFQKWEPGKRERERRLKKALAEAAANPEPPPTETLDKGFASIPEGKTWLSSIDSRTVLITTYIFHYNRWWCGSVRRRRCLWRAGWYWLRRGWYWWSSTVQQVQRRPRLLSGKDPLWRENPQGVAESLSRRMPHGQTHQNTSSQTFQTGTYTGKFIGLILWNSLN